MLANLPGAGCIHCRRAQHKLELLKIDTSFLYTKDINCRGLRCMDSCITWWHQTEAKQLGISGHHLRKYYISGFTHLLITLHLPSEALSRPVPTQNRIVLHDT